MGEASYVLNNWVLILIHAVYSGAFVPVIIPKAVLHIRRGNRDSLGIISHLTT